VAVRVTVVPTVTMVALAENVIVKDDDVAVGALQVTERLLLVA